MLKLVCFVYLVDLVHLVNQTNETDQTNQITVFFSILLDKEIEHGQGDDIPETNL
jgi:hypothetical protein